MNKKTFLGTTIPIELFNRIQAHQTETGETNPEIFEKAFNFYLIVTDQEELTRKQVQQKALEWIKIKEEEIAREFGLETTKLIVEMVERYFANSTSPIWHELRKKMEESNKIKIQEMKEQIEKENQNEIELIQKAENLDVKDMLKQFVKMGKITNEELVQFLEEIKAKPELEQNLS